MSIFVLPGLVAFDGAGQIERDALRPSAILVGGIIPGLGHRNLSLLGRVLVHKHIPGRSITARSRLRIRSLDHFLDTIADDLTVLPLRKILELIRPLIRRVIIIRDEGHFLSGLFLARSLLRRSLTVEDQLDALRTDAILVGPIVPKLCDRNIDRVRLVDICQFKAILLRVFDRRLEGVFLHIIRLGLRHGFFDAVSDLLSVALVDRKIRKDCLPVIRSGHRLGFDLMSIRFQCKGNGTRTEAILVICVIPDLFDRNILDQRVGYRCRVISRIGYRDLVGILSILIQVILFSDLLYGILDRFPSCRSRQKMCKRSSPIVALIQGQGLCQNLIFINRFFSIYQQLNCDGRGTQIVLVLTVDPFLCNLQMCQLFPGICNGEMKEVVFFRIGRIKICLRIVDVNIPGNVILYQSGITPDGFFLDNILNPDCAIVSRQILPDNICILRNGSFPDRLRIRDGHILKEFLILRDHDVVAIRILRVQRQNYIFAEPGLIVILAPFLRGHDPDRLRCVCDVEMLAAILCGDLLCSADVISFWNLQLLDSPDNLFAFFVILRKLFKDCCPGCGLVRIIGALVILILFRFLRIRSSVHGHGNQRIRLAVPKHAEHDLSLFRRSCFFSVDICPFLRCRYFDRNLFVGDRSIRSCGGFCLFGFGILGIRQNRAIIRRIAGPLCRFFDGIDDLLVLFVILIFPNEVSIFIRDVGRQFRPYSGPGLFLIIQPVNILSRLEICRSIQGYGTRITIFIHDCFLARSIAIVCVECKGDLRAFRRSFGPGYTQPCLVSLDGSRGGIVVKYRLSILSFLTDTAEVVIGSCVRRRLILSIKNIIVFKIAILGNITDFGFQCFSRQDQLLLILIQFCTNDHCNRIVLFRYDHICIGRSILDDQEGPGAADIISRTVTKIDLIEFNRNRFSFFTSCYGAFPDLNIFVSGPPEVESLRCLLFIDLEGEGLSFFHIAVIKNLVSFRRPFHIHRLGLVTDAHKAIGTNAAGLCVGMVAGDNDLGIFFFWRRSIGIGRQRCCRRDPCQLCYGIRFSGLGILPVVFRPVEHVLRNIRIRRPALHSP